MDNRLQTSVILRDENNGTASSDDTINIQDKIIEDLKDFIRKDENTETTFLALYQENEIPIFMDLVMHLLKQLDENHQEDLRKFLKGRLAQTHLASGSAAKDSLTENIADNLTISGGLAFFATCIGGPLAGGGVFIASEAVKTGYDLVTGLVKHDKLTTQKATAIHFVMNVVHPEIINPTHDEIATPSVVTTIGSYLPTLPKLSSAFSSLWNRQAAATAATAVEMQEIPELKKTN